MHALASLSQITPLGEEINFELLSKWLSSACKSEQKNLRQNIQIKGNTFDWAFVHFNASPAFITYFKASINIVEKHPVLHSLINEKNASFLISYLIKI